MNPTPLAMLRSHPFVAGFDPHHVERLAKLARLEHFDREVVLFHEGDEGETGVAGPSLAATEAVVAGAVLRVPARML